MSVFCRMFSQIARIDAVFNGGSLTLALQQLQRFQFTQAPGRRHRETAAFEEYLAGR